MKVKTPLIGSAVALALAFAAGSVSAGGNGHVAMQAASSAGGSAIAQTKILGLDHPDRIPGSYIVVLDEDAVGVQNVGTAARTLAAEAGLEVEREYTNALRGFSVKTGNRMVTTSNSIQQIAADPRVEFVEADREVWLNATQNGATWGLDRVDQRNLPLNDQYTYNATGQGVDVFIIDTGINSSHQDFGGRVVGGVNTVDGGSSDDCNGHGTHVASTSAGTTYGLAKQANLYAVRVFGCSGGTTNSAILNGVDWAVSQMSGPAVANMSLGGGASQALDDAVNSAASQGMTMVVAAGNDSSNACNTSPARASGAFTVASSTSSDSRSSFSNYGSCVDIFAPGSNITAAWINTTTGTNTISGTSMASPHVAGASALYLGENPGASPSQVRSALINMSTTGVISGTAGSPNRLLYTASIGDGDDDDDDDDGGGGGGDSELVNGQPVTGLSGSQGSELRFTLDVPSDASSLSFDMAGGSGDADLYVRFGAEPTTSSYDCRPYQWGNEESCDFSSPSAGTWHVMVRGYESFSGVSLVGTHDGGSGGGDPDPDPDGCPAGYDEFTGSLSGGRGTSAYEPDGSYYYSSSGTQNGILISPNDAIFDLYLQRWNGSSWQEVDSSLPNSGDEAAQISYNGSSGYYVWRAEIWTGDGDYTFCLDTP